MSMHVTSTIGELLSCSVYVVRECNMALYQAYVQGLFTIAKAANVYHYHLWIKHALSYYTYMSTAEFKYHTD